jgi:hypothetical protein
LNPVLDTSASPQTLLSVLDSADPATPALIAAETGAVLTRERLLVECSDLRGGSATVGMARGPRVAGSISSGPALIKVMFAIGGAAAAAAPLMTRSAT